MSDCYACMRNVVDQCWSYVKKSTDWHCWLVSWCNLNYTPLLDKVQRRWNDKVLNLCCYSKVADLKRIRIPLKNILHGKWDDLMQTEAFHGLVKKFAVKICQTSAKCFKKHWWTCDESLCASWLTNRMSGQMLRAPNPNPTQLRI